MYLFETINRLIVLFSIHKNQLSLQKGGVHEFLKLMKRLFLINSMLNFLEETYLMIFMLYLG
jgi:hypothetical protein